MVSNGKPVGSRSAPFLENQAMRLEQLTDANGVPADDVLEDGNQNAERVVAHHGALGDPGDVPGLGHGNSEAVAGVDLQHHMNVRATVADVDRTVGADLKLRLKLLQNGDLPVSGRDLGDRADFARRGVKVELSTVDVLRGHEALQGRLDDRLRRGRNDVEREAMAVEAAVQYLDEPPNILLQANSLSRTDQMLSTNATEFGIVPQQVGQLGALLYKVDVRQTGDLLHEARGTNDLAQDDPGIVEAQRLVEVTRDQIMPTHCSSRGHASFIHLLFLRCRGRDEGCSGRSQPGAGGG